MTDEILDDIRSGKIKVHHTPYETTVEVAKLLYLEGNQGSLLRVLSNAVGKPFQAVLCKLVTDIITGKIKRRRGKPVKPPLHVQPSIAAHVDVLRMSGMNKDDAIEKVAEMCRVTETAVSRSYRNFGAKKSLIRK